MTKMTNVLSNLEPNIIQNLSHKQKTWKCNSKRHCIVTWYISPTKHSSCWRRLEDVFRLRLQKRSSRRLDQDEHIHLSHTSLQESPRCLGQDQYIRLGHRYLPDIFKTSCSRCLPKTSSKRLQEFLQNRLQDIFKMSSRRLGKISSRRFR